MKVSDFKALGSLWKGTEVCKSLTSMEFAVRLDYLEMSEGTTINSQQCDCKSMFCVVGIIKKNTWKFLH